MTGWQPSEAAEGSAEHQQQQQQQQLLLSMNDFASFKQIGKGKDCVVYSASCEKLGGHSVVLKVYDKAKISAIKQRSIRREARIMRYLTDRRIPHTTAYIGAFQDSKQIYIVMEHCKGGDLLEQLLKEGRAMPEKRVVREVVLPTLTALAHLHAAGIIHRDLKLENLFISSRGHLQLGDFGLAISVLEERAISPVGTLEYMCPEVLRLPSTDLVLKGMVRVEDITPIDEKVDMWSFGVTVYELVTGRSPFEGSSKDEVRAAILGFKMRSLPSFLTASCRDFILKCMCPKAADRPGALTLLSHPWVQQHCTPADLVTIARLPLQLPKVPMGYKQPSSKGTSSSSSAAAAAREGQQQAAAAASSAAVDEHAASPSAVSSKPGPQLGHVPEAKLHGNTSTASSPDSPQIPAFMPAGALTGQAGVPCSNPSMVSTACSHLDHGRSCGSSRSSNSSCILHHPGAGAAPHGGSPSINHTISTDSASSASALSTKDSAASLYQQSLAAMAAGLVGSNGSCSSSQQTGGNRNWAAAAGGSAWGQEPIQESPTDESAAAAASGLQTGHGDAGMHAAARHAPHQQQQQQQQGKPSLPRLDVHQEPLSPTSGSTHKHKKKSPGGGKRLWKWMCAAAGTASPHTSS